MHKLSMNIWGKIQCIHFVTIRIYICTMKPPPSDSRAPRSLHKSALEDPQNRFMGRQGEKRG